MQADFGSLLWDGTWILVDRPTCKLGTPDKILTSRWALRIEQWKERKDLALQSKACNSWF